MADVQLEKGHFRVANRLAEAILDAEFTGTQVRILLALMRLTFGWRRRTVSISGTELARLAGVSGTGGFRRAFHDLIRNGVVLELKEGRSTTYMIQKDYVKWGEYGGNEGKLAARWDKRPVNDDALLRHLEASGQLTLEGHSPAAESDDEMTLQGPPEKGPDPTGLSSLTPQGRGNDRNLIFGETLARGKDRKDSNTPLEEKDHQTVASVVSDELPLAAAVSTTKTERETPAVVPPVLAPTVQPETDGGRDEPARPSAPSGATTRARTVEADEAASQYAIGLSTAANRGITSRWGEQPNPLHYATGLELAAELLGAGVPLELARHAIGSVCHASKNPRPPFTLGYFRGAILDAHRSAEQRELNAGDPGTSTPRGGAPRPIGAVVSADREQAKRELQARYDEARRLAAVAWGKDPANGAAYRSVVAEVNRVFDVLADSAWKERGRETQLLLKCAEAAGFPDFATWSAEHGTTPANSTTATTTRAPAVPAGSGAE